MTTTIPGKRSERSSSPRASSWSKPPTVRRLPPIRRRSGVNPLAPCTAPAQTYRWSSAPTRGKPTTLAAGEGRGGHRREEPRFRHVRQVDVLSTTPPVRGSTAVSRIEPDSTTRSCSSAGFGGSSPVTHGTLQPDRSSGGTSALRCTRSRISCFLATTSSGANGLVPIPSSMSLRRRASIAGKFQSRPTNASSRALSNSRSAMVDEPPSRPRSIVLSEHHEQIIRLGG